MELDNMIADYWSEGYTDDEIIDILLEDGYGIAEIYEAMGYE